MPNNMYNPDLVLVARRKGRLQEIAKQLESDCPIRCEILSADLAVIKEKGIKIQALCPGFTRTEFHEAGGFEGF